MIRGCIVKKLKFIFFSTILLISSNQSFAAEWCYERDLNYPAGMFGQFNDKLKTSSNQINKYFKFGKDLLSEKPERMLFGLAYLEAPMNELSFDRHSVAAQQSREKNRRHHFGT